MEYLFYHGLPNILFSIKNFYHSLISPLPCFRSRLQLSALILSGRKKDLTVLTSHLDIKALFYCSTILVLMMLIFLNGPVLWTWRKRGGYCWNRPCVSVSYPRTIPRVRPTLSAFSRPERRGCRRRVFTSATGDDALWTIRWNRVRV